MKLVVNDIELKISTTIGIILFTICIISMFNLS